MFESIHFILQLSVALLQFISLSVALLHALAFGGKILFQLGLHLFFVLEDFLPQLGQKLVFELAGAHV